MSTTWQLKPNGTHCLRATSLLDLARMTSRFSVSTANNLTKKIILSFLEFLNLPKTQKPKYTVGVQILLLSSVCLLCYHHPFFEPLTSVSRMTPTSTVPSRVWLKRSRLRRRRKRRVTPLQASPMAESSFCLVSTTAPRRRDSTAAPGAPPPNPDPEPATDADPLTSWSDDFKSSPF